MGSRTLQGTLTVRVLAIAGLALALALGTSLGVTIRALERADTDAAREQVNHVLRTLAMERAEGDPYPLALKEVLEETDLEGAAVAIVDDAGPVHRGAVRFPDGLLHVAPGTCASGRDARGSLFRVCAEHLGDVTVIAGFDVERHATLASDLGRVTLALVVVTLALLVLAVHFALRRPLRSLAALVGWAESVAERAPMPPPPLAETEELQRLSASFATLVRRLLDALDRERSTAAHIAHELRTPLTTIIAELENIPASPESDAAVPRIRQDVARLSRVIDAVLVLSRPEGDQAGSVVVNVADVARELAESATKVDAPDEALVEGDAELVRMALENLLDNARKYSGHAAVRLTISREGSQDDARVRVAVEDDGPGLPVADRTRMFDRHWRGVSDRGGSGLGLALVAAVAQRHAGEVRAECGEGGRGLIVAFTVGPLVGWHVEEPRA